MMSREGVFLPGQREVKIRYSPVAMGVSGREGPRHDGSIT
jgi:hypothetical protein